MMRALLCLGIAVATFACAERARDVAADHVDVETASVSKGPVTVTVSMSPKAPRLSDEPTFMLMTEADAGVNVAAPAVPATLGPFQVRDYHEAPAQERAGKRIVIRTWTLEPAETGRLVVPSMALACTDSRADAEHAEFVVDSPELAVEVTSVLAGPAPTLDQLRGPGQPLPVTRRFKPWPWVAGAAGVLCVAALVMLLVRRQRARAAAPIVLTPRELAQREFAALAGAGFLARDDVAGFYVELTAVVRRYIERTTGIRAPEQTTPEFLRAMRGHPAFDSEQQSRLKAFLEAADLVKFAAVRPDRGAVNESFRRGQEFVGIDGQDGRNAGVDLEAAA